MSYVTSNSKKKKCDAAMLVVWVLAQKRGDRRQWKPGTALAGKRWEGAFGLWARNMAPNSGSPGRFRCLGLLELWVFCEAAQELSMKYTRSPPPSHLAAVWFKMHHSWMAPFWLRSHSTSSAPKSSDPPPLPQLFPRPSRDAAAF